MSGRVGGYSAILSRVQEAASRCGRAGQVRLLAVSKTQPPEKLLEAKASGCLLFGENYVQELVSKAQAVAGVEWHFIGHLQTNKVRQVLPLASLIHSVDREALLEELNKRAEKLGKIQPILLEVNVGAEASKSGVLEAGLRGLADKALKAPNLRLDGLMAIPPADDAEGARPYFRRLRELRDGLEQDFDCRLPELSMGMSGDFEVAVEEGATLVRVGTAIFGARG